MLVLLEEMEVSRSVDIVRGYGGDRGDRSDGIAGVDGGVRR